MRDPLDILTDLHTAVLRLTIIAYGRGHTIDVSGAGADFMRLSDELRDAIVALKPEVK